MKQSLQLKIAQQLTLTPQLQQSIKLLQLSTLDLQSEVDRMLLDNPLIERMDDGAGDAGGDAPATEAAAEAPGSDGPDSPDNLPGELTDWGRGAARGDDDFDPLANVPCPVSLREHLLAQLGEIAMSTREHGVVSLLIEELDEQGFLPQPLDAILAELPAELGLTLEELEDGLALLQGFDPAGVGALDLPGCLLLQLARLPAVTPGLATARAIVQAHLPLLGQREYGKLKKLLGVGDDELRLAQQLIASLTPHPAADFGGDETHYIVPDVLVVKRKGRWRAELNPAAVPRLRVNPDYARLVSESRGESGELAPRLQEAKWFVKNIQQRFDTILKVSESIANRQQAFFEQGEVAMRPLILRDIAEELGLHESTISRVTTQKYLLCARGLFELKYFFGSALETDSGGECSATAIKALIKQLIDAEDRQAPLSDSKLVELLNRQGIQVARRTVAKYREALQIPAVALRKAL
ncbi:RNA polymerase RpoN-/SigL-like sigma 54 subunit [Crenobacter luteus]|uniref:RNA polymerase factor sigma-54 n=1 Tax=Crenobacter luteus TaxID=1452487 RepID=UPI001053756C|nr:RNA polymerase factor sigma-54 [Crenobacter luteus]TCP15579.1 RNA polymerase RpoN-/SigL-like sigma 54 subunit [Crenobacter luteus]